MSAQMILVAALAGVASFLSSVAVWVVRRSVGRVDELERRVHANELAAAHTLATKEDVGRMGDEVRRWADKTDLLVAAVSKLEGAVAASIGRGG